MIPIVKGDLLKSDCDVIVHQANCFAKMGAGIAKQIVAKYPMSGLVDKSFKIPVGSRERLGTYSEYKASNKVSIVNMYSQYDYGRGKNQTDYKAMEKAFIKIMREVKGNKVGLPYLIGCGLAGGDWKIVYSLLEKVSTELEKDVYLYKFNWESRKWKWIFIIESENIRDKSDLIKVGNHLMEVILSTSKSGLRKEVLYPLNENAAMSAQQEVFNTLNSGEISRIDVIKYLANVLGSEFHISISEKHTDEEGIKSFNLKVSWK